MALNVVIADDHAVVRDGIRAVIKRNGRGIKVIGEAANGRELLRDADRLPANVYLLDITMPGINGIDACKKLHKEFPRRAVAILSMHDSAVLLEKALEAGARGYILKENASEEIVPAIRAISRGEIFVSDSLRRFIDGRGAKESRGSMLTPREREIIQLVAEGQSNKQIAHVLCISLNTVLTHRKNIARKLDVHSQADLIRFALKHAMAVV